MTGSKDAAVVDLGGTKVLKMTCNFRGTTIDRASWDRYGRIDLAPRKGVQFLFYCRDVSPIGYFSVYFHSGGGWYCATVPAPSRPGWNAVKVRKKDTGVEDRPGGWGRIDRIRISAWRGKDADTEFYIAALGLLGRPSDAKVVLVRADAGTIAREARIIADCTRVMSRYLDRIGLEHMVLSDLDVTAERLKGRKLVILPYNPVVSDRVGRVLVGFVGSGGKVLAFYNLPPKLQEALGIRTGSHVRQNRRGQFASIRPAEGQLTGAPPVTRQASWNIHDATVVKGRSRVAAWWFDDKGKSTGKGAVVVSDTGAFMTHIMLADDPDNKQRLLLAVIGQLAPALWREAAEGRIDRIGRVGPFDGFAAAQKAIKADARDKRAALDALHKAAELRDRARVLCEAGKFDQSVAASGQADEVIIQAYILAQDPLKGEHRAFWCHDAFGLRGVSWDQAIKNLADNGFTAILPNMLWGGVAFYKSDVLPVAPEVKERGDQIALCVAACKKYGLECHVWKVNYNMGWRAPREFMARMKAEGRTQVEYGGKGNDRWLCPSHPANQKLEIESMVEVARKYDVAGVHFDYIRYPGRGYCFCKGCRQRFEKSIGAKVANWPADVRRGSVDLRRKWLDFRRRQITTVVAEVAERVRKIKPGVKISAAVFRNWPADRDAIGQDWKLWCDRGYLDFVCPMDYTPRSGQFDSFVTQQLPWTGKVPCYPGIGLSTWPDKTDICKLIEQIKITRRHRTGGFTIFNYGSIEARHIVPQCGKGITRKD